MKTIWSAGEKVYFGKQSMGSLYRYGVKRGSLLMFPRPNRSEVCSKDSELQMRNDSLLLGSMDHLNEVTRNQYE